MSDHEVLRLCTIPESDESGPPAVICVALWRMGTASLAAAFNDLGLRPHHALDMMDSPSQWASFEKAAEATWPAVSPAAGQEPPRGPFTREDAIYGKYGAVTEIGAAFSEQLIQAYPEAKVVIVRRDFEKWWPSFKSGVLDSCYDVRSHIMINTVLPFVGMRVLHAMRKTLMGFFGVSTPAELTEAKAREVYDRHFERVRELVPEERRLEYTLGDGWVPLCAFLGREVPKGEFPFVNEKEALMKRQDQETDRFVRQAVAKLTSWIPGFAR